MAFDTFDEGIAPGGLRSKNEIKILICYLYETVKDKMSQSLIVEAIRSDELANFFEIVVAFEELASDGTLIKSDIVDGEQTYVLSANGRVIANQLETTLAHSVKRKSYDCAIRLLSQRKTARENFVDIEKTENGFSVNCRVSGGEIDLFSFTLYAPNLEQAEVMKPGRAVSDYIEQNTTLRGRTLSELYQHEYNLLDNTFPYQQLTLADVGIPAWDVLHVSTAAGERYIEMDKK